MKAILKLIFCLQILQVALAFSSFSLPSTPLTTSTGITILGAASNYRLGRSVDGAGDFNNDGVDDFIVGSYYAAYNGGSTYGVVYVIYGNQNGFPANIDMSTTLDLTQGFLIYTPTLDYIGSGVASAGDFNKDGVDDIVIGGPQSNSAYVIYGKQGGATSHYNLGSLTISQGIKISGLTGQYFGVDVKSAGDQNGDGVDDIIIGASAYTYSSRTNVGCVYVIYGKQGGYSANINMASFNSAIGYRIIGKTGSDGFGYYLVPAKDVNGDNIADLLLAPNAKTYSVVIYGTKNGYTTDIDVATLTSAQGIFISHTSNLCKTLDAGDFNGDGLMDIAVCRSNYLHIIYGQTGGFAASYNLADTSISTNLITQIGTSTSFGTHIRFADLNQDGFSDTVAVQTSNRVSVIFGQATLSSTDYSTLATSGQAITIAGPPSGEFGFSLGIAGDVDKNGLIDIIIGSVSDSSISGRTSGGQAYLIYSSKTLFFF